MLTSYCTGFISSFPDKNGFLIIQILGFLDFISNTKQIKQSFPNSLALSNSFSVQQKSTSPTFPGFSEQEFTEAFKLYNRTQIKSVQSIIQRAFDQILLRELFQLNIFHSRTMEEILLSSESFIQSVSNISDNLSGKYILPAFHDYAAGRPSFFTATKIRIGRDSMLRQGQVPRLCCRRAVLRCGDDGAASIPKSEPEIKNRCTQEGVPAGFTRARRVSAPQKKSPSLA